MFKEGDLVEYQKVLHFVITQKTVDIYIICPANKVDLFGTEKDRLNSIVRHSIQVYKDNIKLNETGRLDDEE